MLVFLANGDIRAVDRYPAFPTSGDCRIAAYEMIHGRIAAAYARHPQVRAVRYYCAPQPKLIPPCANCGASIDNLG